MNPNNRFMSYSGAYFLKVLYRQDILPYRGLGMRKKKKIGHIWKKSASRNSTDIFPEGNYNRRFYALGIGFNYDDVASFCRC